MFSLFKICVETARSIIREKHAKTGLDSNKFQFLVCFNCCCFSRMKSLPLAPHGVYLKTSWMLGVSRDDGDGDGEGDCDGDGDGDDDGDGDGDNDRVGCLVGI